MKYDIPQNWRQTCDGMGCICSAWNRSECGCDVDWTEREVYELREEVNALHERIANMRVGIKLSSAYHRNQHLTPPPA